MSVSPSRLVAGATFVVLGVLLLLEAADALSVPAGLYPALLLVGLGLALVARR